MKIRNLMLALAGTTLVFSACEKDPDPKVPTTDANIALATILPNPDGMGIPLLLFVFCGNSSRISCR